MKSIKIMLSGMMFFLLGLFCLVADGQTGSWLGSAGIVLPFLGVLIFIVGLFQRDNGHQEKY